MRRQLIQLILCLLLVGCASSDPPLPAAPAATSPAAVHEQFIQALQATDRQTVLALVGEIQFKAGMVDTWLNEAAALQRTSPTIGPFTAVQVLPPTEQGQGATAISVWKYERGADCYKATLAQTNAAWHVTDWRSMGRGTCPTS